MFSTPRSKCDMTTARDADNMALVSPCLHLCSVMSRFEREKSCCGPVATPAFRAYISVSEPCSSEPWSRTLGRCTCPHVRDVSVLPQHSGDSHPLGVPLSWSLTTQVTPNPIRRITGRAPPRLYPIRSRSGLGFVDSEYRPTLANGNARRDTFILSVCLLSTPPQSGRTAKGSTIRIVNEFT